MTLRADSNRPCEMCEASPAWFTWRFCTPCQRIYTAIRMGASALVAKQIRSGAMPKAKDLPCADCDAPALDYDHRDYSRPLDVQPVCRSCNKRRGHALWRQAYHERAPAEATAQ